MLTGGGSECDLNFDLVSLFNGISTFVGYFIPKPSHIGVSRNERADSVTKLALDLSPDNISIPYTDLKPTISKFLHTKWQQRWDINIHNKLFQIQPTLGEWRSAFRNSRREQVIISQLHIGHTRLIHSFILKQEPQPQCLTCQMTCLVRHILISS